MPGNGHVRFGRRAAETDRLKDRHCAAARPHNLVADPAFLMEAWARVRGNKGARSAGVDDQTAYYVESERGTAVFLDEVRSALRAGTFKPLPVKERMIPKPGTRTRRRLGIWRAMSAF